VSTRVLQLSRLGVLAGWATLACALLFLAACADTGSAPAAGGNLYARGLTQAADLYIEPVSSRRLALAGLARLSRLDPAFSVTDSLGTRISDALSVTYEGRSIAFAAVPAENDGQRWGDVIANMVATGQRVSPHLAALPRETIDTAVFSGMVTALDRFSHYSPPEIARDQRAQRDGFSGVGITLDSVDNAFRVTAVSPQSPADRAGIRPEDQIVAIDGVATAGCPHQEVVHQLRGPIGSAVALKVLHPGSAQPRDLRLSRDYVILPTVTMSRDGDILVFRIASFNHSTTQRIAKDLAEAERQSGGKLAGVVLDLRGNPGGLLDQAVSLTDLFVHDGPIISVVGRHPASKQYFTAAGDSIAPKLPVVVLVNGGSASAAEIVAASLQDIGRAVVIGSSSYGKGTVQNVIRLPNDGELVVTWARLITPSGYLLQRHGVVPTLCTAGLGDDSGGVDAGLQRITGGGASPSLTSIPRASLDEKAWSELRQACPPLHTNPAVDVKLAERLLAEPQLYSAALRALPAATRLAQGAVAPEPALTGANRALSSGSR
jgi:carboxyl-terminal processing protease